MSCWVPFMSATLSLSQTLNQPCSSCPDQPAHRFLLRLLISVFLFPEPACWEQLFLVSTSFQGLSSYLSLNKHPPYFVQGQYYLASPGEQCNIFQNNQLKTTALCPYISEDWTDRTWTFLPCQSGLKCQFIQQALQLNHKKEKVNLHPWLPCHSL